VSFDGEQKLEIVFQNENVVAVVDGRVRALIRVLEADAVGPITTETLRCGQRVTVAGISTPALMRTPEAPPSAQRRSGGTRACCPRGCMPCIASCVACGTPGSASVARTRIPPDSPAASRRPPARR
jgi:hypothetical protein